MPKDYLPKGVAQESLTRGLLLDDEQRELIAKHVMPDHKSGSGMEKKLRDEQIKLKYDLFFDNDDKMYVIYKTLGKGAFGTTYLAQDDTTGEFVAIKQQKAKSYDPSQEGVLKEAGFMAAMGVLKNVIRIETNRETWIIQNLYDGNDCAKFATNYGQKKGEIAPQRQVLSQVKAKKPGFLSRLTAGHQERKQEYLEPNAPLLNLQLKFFQTALQELMNIHSRGILHLDIKPANMIVGPDGNIYMIDFGLSGQMNHEGKLYARVKGTPHYFAPELFGFAQYGSGKFAYTTAIDVYAFGLSFISDFKLIEYLKMFNGVLFDKNIGDEFIKILKNTTHNDPKKRPSLAELQLTFEKLQDNVVLNQGLDLLNCTGNDVINYLRVLRSNGDINMASVHLGQHFVGQEALNAIISFLKEADKNNFSEQDYVTIVSRVDKIPHATKLADSEKLQIIEAKQRQEATPPSNVVELINKFSNPERIMSHIKAETSDTKSAVRFTNPATPDFGTVLTAQVLGFLKSEFGSNISSQTYLAGYIKGLLEFLQHANSLPLGPMAETIRTDPKLIEVLAKVIEPYGNKLPAAVDAQQAFIDEVLHNPQIIIREDIKHALQQIIPNTKTQAVKPD